MTQKLVVCAKSYITYFLPSENCVVVSDVLKMYYANGETDVNKSRRLTNLALSQKQYLFPV